VVADPLPDLVVPGESVRMDVHLVNDLRHEIDFAVVDAVATWTGGEQRWRFGGAVPADDVVKVGEIRFDVPEADGTLTVELAMTSGSVTSTNGYTATITPP